MMRHICSELSNSTLTGVRSEDIQPNAVDLRLDAVFRINPRPFIMYKDNEKVHRGSEPVELNKDGMWYLDPGTYEVVMENQVTIGEGEAGFVITRSTLNRNGVFLTSGLYDSGYQGLMAAAMHIVSDGIAIEPGSRIGQFLLFDSETLGSYNGSYGKNSEHDKQYTKVT